MALTEEDLKSLRLLMREEIHDAFEQRFEPFRRDVDKRFREVDRRFEGLHAQNEKCEQEFLFIKGQLGRREQHLTEISKELVRHTKYIENLDNRVTELEKKVA